MKRTSKHFYVFGVFKIDVLDRTLLGRNGAVSLTPKAFDTLLFLVENNGRVLSRKEIMAHLWPDSFVEENNLAQNVSLLRKALGEEGNNLIETVPKRGYRFTAEVDEQWDERTPVMVRQQTRARVIVEEEVSDP